MFSIIDLVPFFFDFNEPGGTSHLLPGRPLEAGQRFTRPRGSGFFIMLTQTNMMFVHPDGTLTERPLGQMRVRVGVRDPDVIVCRVRLTDENMDDAVRIQVSGVLALIA